MKIYLAPKLLESTPGEGSEWGFGSFTVNLDRSKDELRGNKYATGRIYELEVPDDFFEPSAPIKLTAEVKEVKA